MENRQLVGIFSDDLKTVVMDKLRYMTDFGPVDVPPDVGREYRAAVWRKDGALDMRFNRARRLAAWESIVNRRVLEYYNEGGESRLFCAPSLADGDENGSAS